MRSGMPVSLRAVSTVYDYIVVGAGSSGAALAARLSEDADRSVLLLEAGPDYATTDATPHDLRYAHRVSVVDHDWGFTANATPDREVYYPRGRVTGGSSAVNGTLAIRGTPEDFDEWAALGNEGWSWEDCLPFFRKLEHDLDASGDFHGKNGPLPVVRWRPEEMRRPGQAFIDVCQEFGFPYAEDFNDPEATGVSPMAQNRNADTRISTAMAYLEPIRNRLNLTIRGGCLVNRVLIEDGRATGVEVDSDGEMQTVRGRNVVLSAGAIMSPPILVRSGIGAREDVEAVGATLVRELPGVGRNLIDHPLCSVVWRSKPGVSVMPDPPVQTMLRYTASGGETNDMQVYMVNHFPGREGNFALLVILQRPKSRGRLHFESADYRAQPRIELNFFSDPEGDDVRRLREGLQLSQRMGEHPAIAQYAEALQTPSAEVLADNDALDAYVRANGSHNFHPVGTAKMGPASDPGAVVDAQCRVHGVEGLRVVDASIMPEIVRANTNLTCIMIGERVAALVRSER